MNRNVGNTDKVIRIIMALVLFTLSYFDIITGNLRIIATLFGAILLFTAYIKTCAMYYLLNINTWHPDNYREV